MPEIAKISGTAIGSIAKVSGTTKANIAKFAGIDKPSGSFDYGNLVTDNLYQYYDAGESSSYGGSGTTWTDIQGNHDLTLAGGPTYTSTAPAHFDFDFVNDSADASQYDASFNDMSVEIWFRAAGISSSARYSLVSALQTSLSNRRFLLNIDRSRRLRILWFGSTGTNLGTLSPSGTTITTNTWYHLCATKSGTTSTLYLNGSSIGSTTLSSSTLGTCDVFGVAKRHLSSQDLLNGDVAKVRIYSDALSSSEVLSNYNEEKSYFGHK